MITAHYIDGVSLADYPIKDIKGLGGPGVDSASYSRGGRPGVALARPVYRGFVFTIDYYIIGTSFSNYVDKRDNFLRLMRLKADPALSQLKALRFDLSDLTQRSLNVIVGQIKADVNADNPVWGIATVPYQSEREYLVGPDKTATVRIYDGGGFAVPYGVPFDISNTTGTATQGTLSNNGNADSYPTVRVYGTLPSFDLLNETTGKTLSCSQALASDSDYIDIDFYNRTAVLNDTTNILNTISGDWWWVQPGDNVVKLSTAGTDPDSRAEFTYQDAFQGV